LSKTDAIKRWFSSQVEEEVEDDIPYSERVVDIAIAVFSILIGLHFAAHQMGSTGFFTAAFGPLEMLLLYGFLLFWLVSSSLEGIFGRKHLSRDFDSFGGLIFATVGIAWLFVVFPFEFEYFADMSPDFLRFLLQWISNDIVRGLMVLGIILHLVAAVYSAILRVAVRKARARKK
jgi:hypothetical protein